MVCHLAGIHNVGLTDRTARARSLVRLCGSGYHRDRPSEDLLLAKRSRLASLSSG